MRYSLMLTVCAGLLILAGCTWGLTDEQAAQVRKYKVEMKDKRAKLKMLEERLVVLTEKLKTVQPGEPLWKGLLKERDEVVALIKDTKSEIEDIVKKTKDLEANGVPGWSVALNVALQALGYIFGAGGVGAALVTGIKNKALRGVANTVIGVVEDDLNKTTAKTVKAAIKEKAEAEGTEPLLNSLVKKAGG